MVQSSFGGNVREGPVTIVVIERIPGNARHEDVGKAVVIVVGHRHADVESGACQSRSFRNVGKDSIAVVAEQAIPVFRRVLLKRRDIRAIREENVGPAVAVVVKYGYPARHRLRRVPGWSLAAVQLKGDGLIRKSDWNGARWGRPKRDSRNQ